MGVLFISHSRQDNEAAIKVRDWLKTRGWSHVFLDLDPVQGMTAGRVWQQELKEAGERCSGVLILLSPAWVASRWCQTELLVADQLGKKIFPIFVAPTSFESLPLEIKAKYQIIDISSPDKETDGFERLAIGLKRAGLDPKSFGWPPADDPHRSAYRGLQSLDEDDAAIFFGRDALITKGIDTLRRMRDAAPERMLVILGASGAGKSSFLKAGLIARLKRDEENFVVLPVIRPEQAAMSGERGLARSLACPPHTLKAPEAVQTHFAAIRAPVVERLKRFDREGRGMYDTKPPTIVIAIDQAEELFSSENVEGAALLELLAAVVRADGNVVIIVTIRSNSFERLQIEPCLGDVRMSPFSLSSIPHGAFKDLIECPAHLLDPPLVIEPALTEQLLEDLATDDALPLLAFTLERLLNRRRGQSALTLAHYTKELGGLEGAIAAAVEAAFFAASRDPALPRGRAALEKLARAAFIPALVQIDDVDAEPRRRVERLDALPQTTRSLLRHLIDERLLTCDRRKIGGSPTDVVEVAHEAILRQWPALKAWIAEERDALRALDGVRTAAAEWQKQSASASNGQINSWLAHRGGRLEEAEALLVRPEFASALDRNGQAYLAACRASENAERLLEKQGILRTRRLQRGIGVLIAIAAVLVLSAGLGITQLLAGISATTADTLASQAEKAFEEGYYDRSARYALAGLTVVAWPFMADYGSEAEAELRGVVNFSSTVAVLRGHGNMVLSAAFSRDGRRVVTGSRDGTARVWDAATGKLLVVLSGHQRPVNKVVFSPDGSRIVTASDDGTARIWDAHTSRILAILHLHSGRVLALAISPDGTRIATGSSDGTATIWDANSDSELATLRGHKDQIFSVAFNPDGSRLVTASGDKMARVWNVATGEPLVILRGHQNLVEGATFSPDGTRVATASDDRTARIWDTESGRQLAELRGHEDAVTGVAFSADGTRIVTSSNDQTARVWDASTTRELAVLHGHEDNVNSAAFSSDGRWIVTASDDGTARVWDSDVATRLLIFRGHEGFVTDAAFNPMGIEIATSSADKTVRLWNSATGQQISEISGHTNSVETVDFSPDGNRLVSASDDRSARIWNTHTGRELLRLQGHEDAVYDASFSPDGHRIVTASLDGTARTWNANTGRLLKILRGPAGGFNSARFSHDGRRIVTTSADGTARIWDANSGRSLLVLSGHMGAVSSATFSGDGTRVVTSGRDRTAKVWDSRNGAIIVTLTGHDEPVLTAVFSSDGNRVLTASQDKTARLWDARSGRELAVLPGHLGWVNSAAFSADGHKVVTASNDGTARGWNISAIASGSRADLIRETCTQILTQGTSKFSEKELRAVRVLDANLDRDPCHPPSLWARLGHILGAGYLHSL